MLSTVKKPGEMDDVKIDHANLERTIEIREATIPAIRGVDNQPRTILISVRLLTEREPTAIPIPRTALMIVYEVDTGTPTSA